LELLNRPGVRVGTAALGCPAQPAELVLPDLKISTGPPVEI